VAHGHSGVPAHLDIGCENRQTYEQQGDKAKQKRDKVGAEVRHRGLTTVRGSRRRSARRRGRQRRSGDSGGLGWRDQVGRMRKGMASVAAR